MLGAILATFGAATPPDFPDTDMQEPLASDSEWADDKNQFEDWLLRVDEGQEPTFDVFY